MSLSGDLVSQFVKVTNDNTDVKKETIVYGTTVEQNGSMFVRLDGSELLTPVSTTADVKAGERVTVMIKNHTAMITGNVSSPSARTDDVKEIAAEVTKFKEVMADKVTANELEAINATIESLQAKTAEIENMDAVNAEIENLKAYYATLTHVSADDIEAITATIGKIEAELGKFTDISAENLEAINADIDSLKAHTADFSYVSADNLKAVRASIKQLDANKLSAKDIEGKYANIDFSNISKATMELFYANSGLIKDVTIGDATISGELVGVTIRGDLIKAGTLVAEKLVIKGTDGLYYKLNTDGESVESKQTDYNSLNGQIITAKSITASKISVKDLVAFGATIGGFKITENSLYSGVKESADNNTRGIFLGNDGQIAFGDGTNFIKYYKDEKGNYKLAISAESIKFQVGEKSTSISDAIQSVRDDLKSNVDTLKDEISTLLRIESSRGTVFKNDSISTVLSAVIYRGSQRITDIGTLKAAMGESAYLQWKWQRLNEDSYGLISADDSRLGNDGFTFTLSPEDVDTKVTFMCELIA